MMLKYIRARFTYITFIFSMEQKTRFQEQNEIPRMREQLF